MVTSTCDGKILMGKAEIKADVKNLFTSALIFHNLTRNFAFRQVAIGRWKARAIAHDRDNYILYMAANIFGRYVWLIDILLRYKSLTFQEISELWKESGLGYGEEMPLRTFHNHRNAIKDIFDVYIECDRKNDYRYYIDEPERLRGNNLRGWLVSSYATLNQIQVDCRLEERIIFEDIPSGQTWLTRIAEAMRYDQVLCITHQGFGKPEPSTFEIEPYCLKVVKRRWYVLARSPYYSERNKEMAVNPGDVYYTYALDRIQDIQETGKTFHMNKDFDVNRYFEGCCGVITSNEPLQRIVLLAYGSFADYLRTLPLHESQHEIESDDESTLFEYQLKPTLDFYQCVLAMGEQVEVLEPESVRNEMRNFAQNMLNNYTWNEGEKPCKD